LTFGAEVLLIGRIVAASADKVVAEARNPFALYRTFVYVEPGTYGIIGAARQVHRPRTKRV